MGSCRLASEQDQREGSKGRTTGEKKDIVRAKNIFAIFSDPNLFRAYLWGTAEVENLNHSDFPLLKDYLFRIESIRSMIESTTRRSKMLFVRESQEKEQQRREEEESEESHKNETEEMEQAELETQRKMEEEIMRRVDEIQKVLEEEKEEERKRMEKEIQCRIDEEVKYRIRNNINLPTSVLKYKRSIKDVALFLFTIHFLYCYQSTIMNLLEGNAGNISPNEVPFNDELKVGNPD